MRCPHCGREAFRSAAGYACGWCGTLEAGGHTLESFLNGLSEAEYDEFWGCATGLENPHKAIDHMFAAAAIIGRFGVNPYQPDSPQGEEYEQYWKANFPHRPRYR